jgi:membrane protein implicated in regulation of membrane protease activity
VSFPELLASQPSHILWLIGGVSTLTVGMMVGEPTLSALGISAFITAIASLAVRDTAAQWLIWGMLSIALMVVFRAFMPKEVKESYESTEAEVSQSIPRGGVGQVTYEGSFWTARCQISDLSIPEGQTVIVVGRHGNTLIVLPSSFSSDAFV